MIYSGADLIRTSGQQAERVERLRSVTPSVAVSPVVPPESSDEALLRFANFLKKEREKSKSKSAPVPSHSRTDSNPYRLAEQHQHESFGRGKLIDIYI